jgi:hypothetical protein
LINQKDYQIFLATDDPQIQDSFLQRYESRLITYPVRSLNTSLEVSIIDAAVILLLLRRLPVLITSNYSGFSRLAAGRGKFEMMGRLGIYENPPRAESILGGK